MENFDFQPFVLYWGIIWAVVGCAVTPLRFDRGNRSPWRGAFIGLVVGIISGEVFGWLIINLLYPSFPVPATWLSMLGGLVLLVPLWTSLKPLERTSLQQPGMIPGTVTPLVFYLAVLSVFPLLWALALAFFEYSPRNSGGPILGLGGNNPFVGLEHFQNMIQESGRDARIFRNSLSNTMLFTTLVLPLNLLITIPLASMIESTHKRLKPLFRTVYFLPVVTSSVGVAVMWGYIFHAQYGILNDALGVVGASPVAWLQDQRATILGLPAAMVAVVVAYLWQDFGYNLIIFIAALQNIPDSLKDAARVDGANPLQTFWYITLPLLRPTLMVVSVLTVISSFQVFDIIQVMTEGGPGREGKTRVLVLDIYDNAFRFEQMGWAAAISVVLFGFVALLTFIQTRVLRTEWEF
jgi:multiple sugar transport system permease protein